MGSAKRRTERILKECPNCIYCGCPANTRDHMPPKIIFDGSGRPKGMEFSACKACNTAAGHDDLVASVVSRAYPSPATETQKSDIKKLGEAIRNNIPGLLEEMTPSKPRHQLPDNVVVVNCDGPIMNRHMFRFAGRLGFAMHYQETRCAVPQGGAVAAWWTTNYHRIIGDFVPDDLLRYMPPPETLRQGRKVAGDQFIYTSRMENNMGAHFAAFRFGFSVLALSADDASEITPPDDTSGLTPTLGTLFDERR